MHTPTLLETKLHVPPVRPERVARPRLIERLNAGLLGQSAGLSQGHFARKLTLVSAPAGFGKTTLLSEWIHTSYSLLPSPFSLLFLALPR